MIRDVFAARLRQTRKQRGYSSARSFADALAIDENRYTRYERAEVEPNLELIDTIATKLQVSVDDLLGRAQIAPSHLCGEDQEDVGDLITRLLERMPDDSTMRAKWREKVVLALLGD